MPAFVLQIVACAAILVVLQVFFGYRRGRLIKELGLERQQVSNLPLRTPELRELELRFIKVNLVTVAAMAAYIFALWSTSK